MATAELMAFIRSGRLMRMIETAPWCSTVTTDMEFPRGWLWRLDHEGVGSVKPVGVNCVEVATM